MERRHVSVDAVVVTAAVAFTVLAMAGYGLDRIATVPLASTPPSPGPPSSSPSTGNPPTTTPSWPPLGNGSSAGSSPPAPGASYDLRLRATTDSATYAPGQPVHVNVTISNIGNATENLTLVGCGLTFGVENASGSVVYDYVSQVLCPAIAVPLRLAPGQSYSASFTWNQVADSGTPVPSQATYTVVPYMSGGNEDTPEVVSSSISIT